MPFFTDRFFDTGLTTEEIVFLQQLADDADYDADNVALDSELVVSAGYQSPTGSVNGSNQTFVFLVAPNAIVSDGVIMRKTASDLTANWTGTTTIVLSVAPTFDVYGVC